MFHSVKLVREQKEEYMDHLFDVLYESIYKLFKFIYYSVMNEKEILKSFQKELARIPEWNQLKVESAYNEFLTASKCTYFPDLIKTIYVLSIKMVLLGIPAENRSKIKIKVPDSSTFYHRLLIHIARDVWKRPYLFYHQVKSIEQQNHLYQFETIIRRKIRSVIRDTIPMELMVQQLSNSDILREDDKDLSSDAEESDKSDSDGEDEESSAEASEQSSKAEDDKDLSSEDGVSLVEASDKSDSEEEDEDVSSAEDEESSEKEHESEAAEDEDKQSLSADAEAKAEDDKSDDEEESKDEKAEDKKSDLEDAEESVGNKESLLVEAEDISSVKAKDVSYDDNFLSAEPEKIKEEDIPVIVQDSSPQDSSIVTLYEEPKKKLIHIQELMKHKKKHGSKSKDRFF